MRRHGIDDLVVQAHLRKRRRHLADLLHEKAVGDDEVVRFVHGGHMLSPLHGKHECGAGDPLAGLPGDLAHRKRDIRCRHELAEAHVHVAVGIEALGRLAHDDEVHVAYRGWQECARARRAHVGIEIHAHAETS